MLKEKSDRPQHHVASFRPDRVHELYERPVVVDVPQNVWQEDEEGCGAADPDPLIQEHAALLGQQQADEHPQSENCDRVFLLKTNARDYAKPQPVTRVVPLHR